MKLQKKSFLNYLGLFKITSAAITPGTQPQKVRSSTIKNEPHPLPNTDKGGNIIASKTLIKLMMLIPILIGLVIMGNVTVGKTKIFGRIKF